jgi:hypothetical protein
MRSRVTRITCRIVLVSRDSIKHSTPATNWPDSSRRLPWCGPNAFVGMKASSVRKKMKQKSFAAAIHRREDIIQGAEDLGRGAE